MIIGIETSCDDTSAALVDGSGTVLSNTVSSQDEIHSKYDGVVPELASRRHCESINVILKETLEQAGKKWNDVDGVAVTRGPGLIGSLLVGLTAAKSLSLRFGLPLLPVHHIEAHAYSIELEEDLDYPYVSLVASGGHTSLFLIESPRDFKILGETRDDAAGEAFDKVARMLELGYPGGPEVESAAKEGVPEAFDFPRPTLDGSGRWNWNIEDYDFSFSGLKTAVYYYLDEHPGAVPEDVAASFQRSLNDCLVYKTLEAAREHGVNRISLGGGVAANKALRNSMANQAQKSNLEVHVPSFELCTDNAAMIAYRAQQDSKEAELDINADPNLPLGEAN